MSQVRLVVVVVSVAMCVGVLVGCSSPAVEPVGLTGSPTVGPTPTPTPTATTPEPLTGVVQDLSDAGLGIVFEDAPALQGDSADVYNWLATYEKEYWRMLTTNTVSPAFSIMASAEVQARMQQTATDNMNDKSHFGGVFHSRIGTISVDGNAATGSTCYDYRDVTAVDIKGPLTLKTLGVDVPILTKVTLVRGAGVGQWLIQSETRAGTC